MTTFARSAVALVIACIALLPDAIAMASGPGCPADLNGDRVVNGADLGALLGNWGGAGTGDVDGNGIVDGADLGAVLGAWGTCQPVVPAWATLVEAWPDPAVVTDAKLRDAIVATGLAWRVRDTGTQMEMLLVPPGTFRMGCLVSCTGWKCDLMALPAHEVTLTHAFYLGRYEVTQAQWVAKMGSNPSSYRYPPDAPIHPVDGVTWQMTQGFMAATGMRLPSEAEWEFACRAGTETPFYNGTRVDAEARAIGWCAENTPYPEWSKRGGLRLPNALGFHDMAGNVWEWVKDWYGEYPDAPQVDPIGPSTGTNHVIRGGSFVNHEVAMSSSMRYYDSPGYPYYVFGFRSARNP